MSIAQSDGTMTRGLCGGVASLTLGTDPGNDYRPARTLSDIGEALGIQNTSNQARQKTQLSKSVNKKPRNRR